MIYRHQAVDALMKDMNDYRIVLTEDGQRELDHWIECDLPASDPMVMCEQRSQRSIEIATLKGKPTRKRWQVSITRKDNGYWEHNSYPL